MTGTINITGTGGILEGDWNDANIDVKLDPVYGNFNGADSVLTSTLADHDNIWATNGGCAAAWVYPKSDGESTYGRIFDKDQWRLYVGNETSGMLTIYFRVESDGSPSSEEWNTTTTVLPINAWSHVAVTWDSDASGVDPVIYLNGVAQTLTNPTNFGGSYHSSNEAGNSLAIGNRANAAATWDGYIMDVKIYKNVAVTATNVAKMASMINVDKDAANMPTSGLQGWYKLNASTTADSSGESNTLSSAANMGSVVNDAFTLNVQDGTGTSGVDSGENGTVGDTTSTSLSVGDATTFANKYLGSDTTGDASFYIMINNEIMRVSNINHSSNVLTVERGALGTTAASHSSADIYYACGTGGNGTFKVTTGKADCLPMTSAHFDGSSSAYVGSTLTAEQKSTRETTFACWFNADDITQRGIAGRWTGSSQASENGLFIDASSKLGAKFNSTLTDGSADYYNESVTGATTLTANRWHHVVVTASSVGDDDFLKIYLDGKLDGTNSSYGRFIKNSGDQFRWGWGYGGGGTDELDGDIRDVRIYAGKALTDDQVSSLYANTLLAKPELWFKADAGTGTDAAAFGQSGIYTATSVSPTNIDSTWRKGIIDINGDFNTAATGTFSAPQNEIQCSSHFQPAGTWIHNDGTFRSNNTAEKDFNIDASTALYNWIHDGSTYTIEDATDGHTIIEKSLTINAGKSLKPQDGADVTFGTDSQVCTVTNNGTFQNRNNNNTVTFKGASTLYPFAYEGTDFDWDHDATAGNIQNYILSNCNWNPDITTGEYVNIQLAGDCEFDAVTVSANSTLDINGKRAKFSGTLTNSGTIHYDGLIDAYNINDDGTANDTATSDLMLSGIGSDDAVLDLPTGTFRTIMINAEANGKYDQCTVLNATKLIVAEGQIEMDGGNWSVTDCNIATGAELDAGAGALTVAGDFISSGGLIGTSCLSLDGSDDYAVSAAFADDRNTANNGDYTIEFWFKRTSTSGNETLFDYSGWSGSAYTGNARTALYMNGDGVLFWDTRTGGGSLQPRPQTPAGKAYDDSKWHHVALRYYGSVGAHTGTYPSGAKEIWVDGKLEARVLGGQTGTDGGGTASMGYDQGNQVKLNIGRNTVGYIGDYFTGEIDEFRMWSDIRTDAEIRDNMFGSTSVDWGIAVDSANLRHYYDCDFFHSTKLEDTATSTTGEAHLEVDLDTYNGASASGLYGNSGLFTHGTSTIKMTGTGKKLYNKYTTDANLDICHLDITGTITHKQIGDNSGGIDILGHCTITGTLTQDNDENLRLYGNNVSNKPRLFIPKAINLDGSDDYINCGTNSTLDITSTITCSAWVKIEKDNSDTMFIISKNDDSGDKAYNLVSTNAQVQFSIYDGATEKRAISTTTVNDGNWHHISGTYDGSTVKVYVDGTVGGTTISHSGDIDSHDDEPVFLGQRGDNARRMKGELADARIYDVALSATEIATLGENILPNQGRTDNLVAWWKLNEGTGTSAADSSINSNTGTASGSPSWITGNPATAVAGVNRIYGYGPTTTYIPECTTERIFAQTGTTVATGNHTITQEMQVASGITYDINGTTATVKGVDMNNGTLDMQTAKSTLDFSHTTGFDNDCTGTLKTGIINTNAAAIAKSGVGAISLDGHNDYVACGTNTNWDITDNMSVSIWAYREGTKASGNDHLMSKYAGSNGQRCWRLTVDGSDAKFSVGTSGGLGSVNLQSPGTTDFSGWHHIAASFEGGVMKLYVDGALVAEADNSSSCPAIFTQNSRQVELGSYEAGNGAWQGYISDARIYNTVINLADVQAIYNSGGGYGDNETSPIAGDNLVAWWIGKDGTGTTLTDVSGKGNNGTLTNVPTWTNPVLTSSSTDNWNMIMGTSGTMKWTGYNTFVEKSSGIELDMLQSTHTFQDMKFKNHGEFDWVVSGTGVDQTFTRCEFSHPDETSKLFDLNKDAASNAIKTTKFIDCEFIRPNSGTDSNAPIGVRKHHIEMLRCKFTDDDGTWSGSGPTKGWSNNDIYIQDSTATVFSKDHNRYSGRYFVHGWQKYTKADWLSGNRTVVVHSGLASDMKWDDTDHIYIDRLRDAASASTKLSGVILDETNKETASITVGTGAFLKLQQESSADITHYTGEISGDYGGEGHIFDDGTSPFEFTNVTDVTNKIGNDIDGDFAGAMNNLV